MPAGPRTLAVPLRRRSVSVFHQCCNQKPIISRARKSWPNRTKLESSVFAWYGHCWFGDKKNCHELLNDCKNLTFINECLAVRIEELVSRPLISLDRECRQVLNSLTQPNALGAVGADASFALSLLRKKCQHFRGKHSIHAPAALWRGTRGSSLFHSAGIWRLAYGA